MLQTNWSFMKKMKIEIWSDIACPYCYIGKRKLEKALQQFPQADKVELLWHSYELNPDLQKTPFGKSYAQYIAETNGKDDVSEDLKELNDLAKSVGLNYNFDKIIVTNTSDALRVCKSARKYNLATEMEEAFFAAYFTDGKNISDRQTILQITAKVGLDTKEVEQMLDSNEYVSEIAEDIRYSEDKLNLEYIPFYLFNNKTIIQGSVDNEVYTETLKKTYADWLINGTSTDIDGSFVGKACSIDGKCS